MQQYPFIFSDEFKYRLQRHSVFWLFWWLFQGFLYSFIAIDNGTLYWLRLPASMIESLIFLGVHMFLSYALMYFVIPRYLTKQRYWHTAVWVTILFLLAALMSGILAITIIPLVRDRIMGEFYARRFHTLPVNIFLALMAGLRGAITIGGIAASIKLMKYWYVKEQRNLQLQKENIAAQLQLLKAQIHPHFLFNTLNNIYSYTQNTSPVASGLVMELSDMLRYMLYECNQPLVPLSEEIKMLKNYCALEKVRYDEHLDLQVDTPVSEDLLIAPLLLLPFVENCFKHGASNLLDAAWISLDIKIEGKTMKMKLINSKPVDEKLRPDHSPGIGIANVQTRLNLLYAGKYDLIITNEAEVYIVNLTLELEKRAAINSSVYPVKKTALYA